MDNLKPQRVENLIEKRLPDGLIIVNAVTNELNAFSPSGEIIWSLIDGNRTVDDIIRQIQQDYGDDPQAGREDDVAPECEGEVAFAQGETPGEQVRSFLELLKGKSLIVFD
jgi:hypothetical protein